MTIGQGWKIRTYLVIIAPPNFKCYAHTAGPFSTRRQWQVLGIGYAYSISGNAWTRPRLRAPTLFVLDNLNENKDPSTF